MKEEKKLNLPQSLLLLVLIIFSVAVCIRLKTGGPMIGLFASWIFIYLVCKIVRIPYDNVDIEFTSKPKKWDTKGISRFMNVMGITSSVIDVIGFLI